MAGEIPACRWVKLACQRHLDDLERSKSLEYPYRFDDDLADRACRFIEGLPHTKGLWADRGELLKLRPWQKFISCVLLGWIERSTGRYRFRDAYLEIPRKNAKSTWAAAIGLYKFAADKEHGAEVYSGATTEKQAWEVFRPARLMAERTPKLCSAFGIQVGAKNLAILKNGSRFEPLIGKPGEGASPSCAIVDEYHEHDDDTLVDAMKTGMGARENPLMLKITTAGSNRSGPCYAAHQDVVKILEGTLRNEVTERTFGIIYTVDDDDDWRSPAVLPKANPNFDVSVLGDYLREQQTAAIGSPRLQNAFLTKHLNKWVSADVAWLPIAKWDACADSKLKIEQFAGEECWEALDLASRVDTASKVRLFRRMIEAKMHFYAFGNYYINEGRLKTSINGAAYAGWANVGRMTVTPGDVTDYNWIADDIVKDSKQFIIREIPHDPYHAAALVQFIQAREDWPQNVEFVEFRQTVELMSPAMKEFEAAVMEGRFHHDGDPVLGWMISNVVCHRDAKDNIFPRKEREENKIDGAVALLMAFARARVAGAAQRHRESIFDRGTIW